MNDETPFSAEGFSSVCIHGGSLPDAHASHLTPIYASSTFTFETAEEGMDRFSGKQEGYIYSRWGNPTFTAAEKKIALLEGFKLKDADGHPLQLKALLHASGMAALTTLFLSCLKSGNKILSHHSLYGGTSELFEHILPGLGIKTVIVDMHDISLTEETIMKDPSITLMFLETPANPTLQCVDLEALIAIAGRRKVLSAVDNTFATPYLQQPFRYGADFVFHSTTKFLNGHGTAIGGVLIGRDLERMKGPITKTHRLIGGNSNPFDAFLLTQGMKTLDVRMERHCHNAMQVAKFLEAHPKIARVNYVGLSSHPDYIIAKRQMKHPGAMMSFELKEGLAGGKRFINRLQMCVRAVSLGTCDTLICHPASMTHYGVAAELRRQYGITDGLIRMSVGIENVEDIINDLEQALN
jgi:methionine-gamma-lyase